MILLKNRCFSPYSEENMIFSSPPGAAGSSSPPCPLFTDFLSPEPSGVIALIRSPAEHSARLHFTGRRRSKKVKKRPASPCRKITFLLFHFFTFLLVITAESEDTAVRQNFNRKGTVRQSFRLFLNYISGDLF